MDANDNPRYRMWCKLIPNYSCMNSGARHKHKVAYARSLGLGTYSEVKTEEELSVMQEIFEVSEAYEVTTTAYLGNSPPAPYWLDASGSHSVSISNCAFDFNKKEETMNTETETQRRYLRDRLSTIRCEKTDKLMHEFGLVDDPAPETVKEMKERLAAGLYMIPGKDDAHVWDCDGYIRWRDPAKVEDRAGYEAALKLLTKEYQTVRDDLHIVSPEEGLKILRTFEAESFR